MLERQRHGANPRVFRAVVEALTADYGAASAACQWPAAPGNGYQASGERIWVPADVTIRAMFRDTTLEASQGCLDLAEAPCGLTGQLFVQVSPPGPAHDFCG
jgi:hypothetical protein